MIDNGSGGEGGGFYIRNPELATCITDCEFTNNKAGVGAAIYFSKTDVIMANCLFEENTTNCTGYGGAMHFTHSEAPIITNCVIKNNLAGDGGGIHLFHSSPRITGCIITDNILKRKNSSEDNFSFSHGGGIAMTFSSNPIIRNTLISGNGTTGKLISYGGGIYCLNTCVPQIIDCEISNNNSLWGGGIALSSQSAGIIRNCTISGNEVTSLSEEFLSAGGGIYCGFSSITEISDSVIKDNTSDFGGGIHCFDNSNPRIKNCLIFGNHANHSGGAICADSAFPTVISCTMADNTALNVGGVDSENGSNPFISHCILWNNGNLSYGGPSEVSFECSDVEGWNGSQGSFSADPLFVQGPWGDYYLSQKASGQTEDSPCIDAGMKNSERLDLNMTTTRSDAFFDDGMVDLGYHHPPNILFALYLYPAKEVYANCDSPRLMLDIRTANENRRVNLFFLLRDPEGVIYSGFNPEVGFSPAVSDIEFPGNIDLDGIELLQIDLETFNFPFHQAGNYTFAIAATDRDSGLINSNLSTAYLEIEEPSELD